MLELLEQVHAKREAGFNCAEGVFWGVTQGLGLTVEVSCMTGFGGGIGGTGSVCGALTGAIAAAGVYFGRTDPEDSATKQKCNIFSAKLVQAFEAEMGTKICSEILGHFPGKGPAPAVVGINPKCKRAVEVACTLALAELVQKD